MTDYKLVPVEPTEAMWSAGERAFDRDPDVHHETVLANVWQAMLSAAPEPVEVKPWACKSCNSPRAIDPCIKCGATLTKPADGWDWPAIPDVDKIRALAREVGYAIGVHGTMERDLDLIAAPWVAEAVTPVDLAQHIATGLGGRVLGFRIQDKPCGRWSCNIRPEGWFKLIDLSVMPPNNKDPKRDVAVKALVGLVAELDSGSISLPRLKRNASEALAQIKGGS